MSDFHVQTGAVTQDALYDKFWDNLSQDNLKEAALDGSNYIRTTLRQESIAREIFGGSKKLEASDLDRSVHTDQPRRIEEIEPDSTASYVPFTGTARRRWFKGKRFEIYFGKIESQVNRKSKLELMTYRSDIRKILTDNAVYDMADVEDEMLFNEVKTLLSLPSAAGQTLNLSGGLTAANVVAAMKRMFNDKYPIGALVMSKSLHADCLTLPASSIGDSIADLHYKKGLAGETTLWGIPVITTIKEDIIAPNEFYMIAPRERLGFHYHLYDATLYIKEERDMLEFNCWSCIGIGLAGHKGWVRVKV